MVHQFNTEPSVSAVDLPIGYSYEYVAFMELVWSGDKVMGTDDFKRILR